MTITELHNKLLSAYTPGNLNHICLTLLNLYKNRQYSKLRKISRIISDTVTINIADNGKGFSKFMMLYHPDRACFHRQEIEKLTLNNDYNGLLEYSHILLLSDIEEIADSFIDYDDIDYSPVYEWDFNEQVYSHYGFSIIDENLPREDIDFIRRYHNFYDAARSRLFEETRYEYLAGYLEQMDEFELSSSEIDDLSGVGFCLHARTMDLSNNMITDITPLFRLSRLENLDLSHNRIEFIDALGNLMNLKNVLLTGNDINDISPLFDLPRLEYVDLTGNNIGDDQIEILRDLGVMVDI
jgi:hypothetical protein